MFLPSPPLRTKVNGIVPGLAMLLGALLIGFGSTKPWASLSTGLLDRFDLSVGHDFGFESVYFSSGSHVDLQGWIVAAAVVIGVNGVALIATRIAGLGVLWRLWGLITVVISGLLAMAVWNAVDHPGDVLAGVLGGGTAGSMAGKVLDLGLDAGVGAVEPGSGLWLVTIGSGIALLGGVIPAIKTQVPDRRSVMRYPMQGGPWPVGQQAPFYFPPQSMTPPLPPVARRVEPGYGAISYWPGSTKRDEV